MQLTKIREQIRNYSPNVRAIEIVRRTPTVLLVGISGAGKDTIQRHLLEAFKDAYHHIVSHTTRPPRLNHGEMEKEGVEYHFVDWGQAEQMINERAFIEANLYSDNLYGTSVLEFEQALNEGKIAITDIEVQGVEKYVDLTSNVRPIFILPPDYDTWQKRLVGRYDGELAGHEADIARRMQTAKKELEHALAQDYFYFVLNDDIDQAVADVDHVAHQPQDAPHQDEAAKQAAREILAKL